MSRSGRISFEFEMACDQNTIYALPKDVVKTSLFRFRTPSSELLEVPYTDVIGYLRKAFRR